MKPVFVAPARFLLFLEFGLLSFAHGGSQVLLWWQFSDGDIRTGRGSTL